MVSQSKLDKLILDFVVGTFQCFSIVEEDDFRKLVHGLQPGKVVMTRKTLVSRLDAAASDMRDSLRSKLKGIETVCCTADCWTSFHR